MATWENRYITLQGQEIINKVATGKGKIKITRVTTSSEWFPSGTDLITVTKLKHEMQDFGGIGGVSWKKAPVNEDNPNNTAYVIEAQLDNTVPLKETNSKGNVLDNTEGYSLRQIGVFCKYINDENVEGDEVLMLFVEPLHTDANTDYVPPDSYPILMTYSLQFNLFQELGDGDVFVQMENSGVVTKTERDKDLANLKTNNKNSYSEAINEVHKERDDLEEKTNGLIGTINKAFKWRGNCTSTDDLNTFITSEHIGFWGVPSKNTAPQNLPDITEGTNLNLTLLIWGNSDDESSNIVQEVYSTNTSAVYRRYYKRTSSTFTSWNRHKGLLLDQFALWADKATALSEDHIPTFTPDGELRSTDIEFSSLTSRFRGVWNSNRKLEEATIADLGTWIISDESGPTDMPLSKHNTEDCILIIRGDTTSKNGMIQEVFNTYDEHRCYRTYDRNNGWSFWRYAITSYVTDEETSGILKGYTLTHTGDTADVEWQAPPFAVCTTEGNVAEKTVSVPGFKLVDGARIVVRFRYKHLINSRAYLNVSNTGSKSIFLSSTWSTAYAVDSTNTWDEGEMVELVFYDGFWYAVASSLSFTLNNTLPKITPTTTLATISQGEGHHTMLGKIQKAISSLISHLRDTTNPHSVTKEQVGLRYVPNVATNDQQPTFTEESTRTNIVSGEKLSVLFGKIKKWFSDLKTVAFTGSYTDLSNKPTSMQNPYSLTLTMNSSGATYNGGSSASFAWYAPTSGGTAGYNLISNGSGAPVWQGPLYATCSTASGTQAKTVSITNFKLITGVRVFIKFNNTCANSAPTLNISGTGAKSMVTFLPNSFYNVSSSSGTRIQKAVNTWCAGDILEFVYDGTYWVCVGTSGYPQYSHRNNSYITIGTTEMGGAITYPNDTICDFLCDGTNDTTIIQRAINLASQGASAKIRFLDGDYFIDRELTLFSSIVFEGAGNVSLYVRSQGLLRYDTTSIGVSNKAIFRDIAVDFASPNKDTEGYVGAFENFDLTFENCTITKRTFYQSIWRLFFKCKVKMINTDVSIDMPNSGWGELYDCFWVFGESTVELLNTHIWFTGKNPVNNGVFYDSKGTMTGGWITNTKKDTSNHGVSYILYGSPITFLGTQIRCREFAQEWNDYTPNGFRPSLDSCKIEILDGGSFSCSHASHIDLVLSSSSKTSVIPTCALISNSKLFITFDHQLELRDYAFLEACYVNRVNYKGSGSSSSAKTIDTSTVTSMVKPEFIDTEGTNNE